MERAIIFACLCLTIDCSIVKYYKLVTNEKTWSDAQAFCREKNRELAFFQSEADQQNFGYCERTQNPGWIGLYRDSASATGWTWSGGWYLNYTNWQLGEPNNVSEKAVATNGQGLWYDYPESATLPFYCVAAFIQMEMQKSWEEALQHCRGNSTDLVKVAGQRRYTLTKSLMETDGLDRAWVGLRFFGDRWMWLDGSLNTYLSWAQGEDQCPPINRCGALNKDGLLESRDCQERLHFVCR